MIGKVLRGSDVGGLLRYLYGPGRANEHTGPHLVASWDDAPATLEPAVAMNGRHDVQRLTRLLEQPHDHVHVVVTLVRQDGRPVTCQQRTPPS